MSQQNWVILAAGVLVLLLIYAVWPGPGVGTAPDTALTTDFPETTD